eukprot:COSAG05_NODE_2098_length_3565_cov_1.838430_1_plen_155_part_00
MDINVDIINRAIDESKEDKATGPDDTPVTLWKRSKTGREVLVAMIQLMWLYEIRPEKALDTAVCMWCSRISQAATGMLTRTRRTGRGHPRTGPARALPLYLTSRGAPPFTSSSSRTNILIPATSTAVLVRVLRTRVRASAIHLSRRILQLYDGG